METLTKKLAIIIEGISSKNISEDVMKRIHDFEKSIAPNPELRLSLVSFTENKASEAVKNKQTDSLSPDNWDYWPV